MKWNKFQSRITPHNTDEDLKQAEALVKILKQKKKAEKGKPTLTTEQKERMQAGVVFGWSATKIALEALGKKSGRDVILVKKTLNSYGYKYVNGKFVGSRKVRLRVLPDTGKTKKDKLPSIESLTHTETITVKKFSKKKGKKGKYRKVKRTKTQLESQGHNMNGKSCAICHDNPCPYYSRFKSQKKTTKEQFTTLKQGKRVEDRPPDVNRFGLKEGHKYSIKESRIRADKIKAAHKKGQNVGGTPMAHPEKHDNWEQYGWYPCAYCYEKEALAFKLNSQDKEELENQILRNSYGHVGYHFDGFSLRAFVWRWKGGLFIDKTVYDLAKDFFHSKGIQSARQARKEQGKPQYIKKPATEIIKEQVTEIIKEQEEDEIDSSIVIEDNQHPEGITLSQQAEEEKAKGRQEIKDSLDNAGRKTKKLVVLAKRKFSPEQLIQMAEDLRNER